jgi:hypothetical protein
MCLEIIEPFFGQAVRKDELKRLKEMVREREATHLM